MNRMDTSKRAYGVEKTPVTLREECGALAKTTMERCVKLAAFSEEKGKLTRTFLSAPMRGCHEEIASWLRPLGAVVTIDAAGNLRGFYSGAAAKAPRLLIGSHLDTVPDAGIFDGMLGVAIGVALIERLQGARLPFAMEVVGFSEEEGVRFGVPFIGSRALAGTLDEDLLGRTDGDGVTVRAAIEEFGLRPAEIPAARLGDDMIGYLEFHIEQGPVLEEMGLPLAAVDAIVGQSRLEISFSGRANHAGTAPMNLRRDALAGAAEWISTVERLARAADGLVATVGTVEATPGATNAVAGEARVSLDVRHRDDGVRRDAVAALTATATEIAARRRLGVTHREWLDQAATPMDSALVAQIEDAIRATGCAAHRMTSGAGHDAMILAPRMPSAMIFLRTPGGISHSPEECVSEADVALAIEAGARMLERMAGQK
jgi:allantoate deiminase